LASEQRNPEEKEQEAQDRRVERRPDSPLSLQHLEPHDAENAEKAEQSEDLSAGGAFYTGRHCDQLEGNCRQQVDHKPAAEVTLLDFLGIGDGDSAHRDRPGEPLRNVRGQKQ
jgi:hypothetical protein